MNTTMTAAPAAMNNDSIVSTLRLMEKRREEYAGWMSQVDDETLSPADQAFHDAYVLMLSGNWRLLRLEGFTREQAASVGDYIRDNGLCIYWTSAEEFDVQNTLWVETCADLVEQDKRLRQGMSYELGFAHKLTADEVTRLADIWRKLFTLNFQEEDAAALGIEASWYQSMFCLVTEQDGNILTAAGIVPREVHIVSLVKALDNVEDALNEFIVSEDGDGETFSYESEDYAIVTALSSARAAIKMRLKAIGATDEEVDGAHSVPDIELL